MATEIEHTIRSTRVEVFPALRRHWFLAVLPVVVFVAGAVVLGLKRPVTYTAKANLSVGHVYVTNPVGIPTVLEATQSLAGVYARAIRSDAVTAEARRRLARRSGRVQGQLSATPIPDSPLISVSAESSSADGAIALANAGAAALAKYTNAQIRDNDAASVIAARYRRASVTYRRLLDAATRARGRFAASPSRARRAARNRAAAAADAARLRRSALQASYEAAVQGGVSSVGVEVFSAASTTTTDRMQVLQLLIFVGLAGGCAAGSALAVMRASRVLRRAR
jgi:uncharacterized protein involved in exopolysaccharide biosynthesis